MLGIVLITGFVYLLMFTDLVVGTLVFAPDLIIRGQIWRLITWIFLPLRGTDPMGFFFTLIMLYFYYSIGSTLEREWGAGRFTIYYAIGIALHVVYGFIAYYGFGWPVFLSPMYLNLSMFFAFAVIYPDHVIRLFMIIPIKMKWAAWLNAAFFSWDLITYLVLRLPVLALLPVVAIGNFFLFCGEDLVSSLRPLVSRMKRKMSPQVINFEKEAKRVKREMANKPYRHKCAVCGKTDTDHPELEFRYCSICNGYHCFCSEHINNHIHFN